MTVHHDHDDEHDHTEAHRGPETGEGHAHRHEHEDEEHPHGGSAWSRLRHAVPEVFGSHSHDSADQLDRALEADADGRRALLVSLAILATTAAARPQWSFSRDPSPSSATPCTMSPTL
jgi:hypothetical protein